MGRRFKDMQTEEQRYAARQAPALQQLAHQADQQAQRHQMDADVYGRPDKDYTDKAKAARQQREADRLYRRSKKLRDEAKRAEKAVAPEPKTKWSWW